MMQQNTSNSTIPRSTPALLRIALGLAVLGLAAGALFAENVEQDGLKLEINPVAGEVPGYSIFQVKARNVSNVGRSLQAQIQLNWNLKNEAGESVTRSSVCQAYLEVPARGELIENVPCKGTDFAKYEFQIVRVLPFIMERSPLNWQKPKVEPQPES